MFLAAEHGDDRLWALHANDEVQKSFGRHAPVHQSNLDTWGLDYLIVGAVVLVVGIMVFFASVLDS